MASPALRRKQLRAAELVATGLTYAEAGELVARSERTITRWLRDPALRAISAGETPTRGELGQVEPENEQQPTPSIVVYDLPPGASPVMHRAISGSETAVTAADTPLAK